LEFILTKHRSCTMPSEHHSNFFSVEMVLVFVLLAHLFRKRNRKGSSGDTTKRNKITGMNGNL